MTAEAYVARLTRDLRIITSESAGGHQVRSHVASEVPLRIHERGVDEGHGLGGPPIGTAMWSYLRAAGVCLCEPHPTTLELRHICDRRETPRFHHSDRRSHPRRLKRALRQVRSIDPQSHDVVYLLVARGWTWSAMSDKVNTSRLARGQEPYTQEELSVFAMAGVDLLVAAY